MCLPIFPDIAIDPQANSGSAPHIAAQTAPPARDRLGPVRLGEAAATAEVGIAS
jgi:hypothetical protein